jgi:hypothetical protein
MVVVGIPDPDTHDLLLVMVTTVNMIAITDAVITIAVVEILDVIVMINKIVIVAMIILIGMSSFVDLCFYILTHIQSFVDPFYDLGRLYFLVQH